jgi:hypothetical protein
VRVAIAGRISYLGNIDRGGEIEMGIHGRIAGAGELIVPAELLSLYALLEDCILSGQISDAELQALLRDDPDFAGWMRSRVAARAAR